MSGPDGDNMDKHLGNVGIILRTHVQTPVLLSTGYTGVCVHMCTLVYPSHIIPYSRYCMCVMGDGSINGVGCVACV